MLKFFFPQSCFINININILPIICIRIVNDIANFTGDNGSLCSVQSSGSDSSSIEKMQCDLSDRCSSSSPQWKRKGLFSQKYITFSCNN